MRAEAARVTVPRVLLPDIDAMTLRPSEGAWNVAYLRELCAAGRRDAELAAAVGVSRERVRQMREKSGIPRAGFSRMPIRTFADVLEFQTFAAEHGMRLEPKPLVTHTSTLVGDARVRVHRAVPTSTSSDVALYYRFHVTSGALHVFKHPVTGWLALPERETWTAIPADWNEYAAERGRTSIWWYRPPMAHWHADEWQAWKRRGCVPQRRDVVRP